MAEQRRYHLPAYSLVFMKTMKNKSKPLLKKLAYQKNMREVYQKLRHLPGFVLLESSDSHYGRYDIMSALPYESLSLDRTATAKTCRDILDDLEARFTSYDDLNLDLPFQGGAIAYLSYDLGQELMAVDLVQKPLSSLPLLHIGFYDWAIITDHQSQTVTLFFAMRREETLEIPPLIESLLKENTMQEAFSFETGFQALVEKSDYLKHVTEIKLDLAQGRCYQVNYTQPFKQNFRGDPWCYYDSLCHSNPVPYAAYMTVGSHKILSFSPERFLKFEQGKLLASPIKGTMKRSADAKEDVALKMALSACPKNRAENIMIVDLMRNDLGKIAQTGSVRVDSLCDVQSFNGVHHLVSDIVADCLPSITPVKALLSCFPGGSITGAPKKESMKVIAEHEDYARGVYCGSIGYFSAHGRFDFNIAIRTVTIADNRLYFAAGGGIVIDSDPESEYLECMSKISAIINDGT